MWVVVVIFVVILIVPVFLFNSLVGKKNQVKNVFASTDALLKKRYDLLPNLVSTVKGYMQHERGLLEKITQMRAARQGKLSDDGKVDLDNQLTKAIAGVMLAVENYPQLKASENFLHLQRTLNELEEQISAARRAYNAAVTDYNTAIQVFPTNILARVAQFTGRKLFEIREEDKRVADVERILKG